MTLEILRAMLTRRPFEPTRVTMSIGEVFEIRHPELPTLTKTGLIIVLHELDGSSSDQFEVYSYFHIASVETGVRSLPKEPVDPSVGWMDKSTTEMNDAVANVKNGGIKSAEDARPLLAKYPLPFIHVPAPAPQ